MPKLEKGSEAARQRMAHLRSLKKNKAAVNGKNYEKSNKVEGKGGINVTGRRRRVAPPNANVAPAPTNVNDVDVDLPDTFDIDDGRTQHEVTAHHTTEVNHMPHSRVANALPISDSEIAKLRRRRQNLRNKMTRLSSQINNAETIINNYRTSMDTNELNRQRGIITAAKKERSKYLAEVNTIWERLENPSFIHNAEELAPNNIVNNAEPFVEEGSGIKNNFSVEYTKMPKLEKGSAAVKERMAHLRSLRKAKTIKGTGDNGDEKPEKMGLARAISISRASLNSNTPFINKNLSIASAENVHLHPQEMHENARLHLEYETRLQAIKNRMLYIERELDMSVVLTTKQRNKYMENWTDLEQEKQQLEKKLLQDESIEEGIAIKQPVVAKFQETDGTGIKKSPWILHVSKYAKTHGISYFQALKMPEVREEYKKAK